MPFRNQVAPEILAYIDENFPQSKAAKLAGYVLQSNVDLAVAELAALVPPVTADDLYGERNRAFAAEVAKLKAMTMAERKAYRRQQQNDAAVRAYIARIEREERGRK